MNDLTPHDPAAFARDFLAQYLAQGFQSLGKRDVDLLVFFLMERDGVVRRDASNFDVARQLRLTPARVNGLRRDAYARWRDLFGNDDRTEQTRRLLERLLTEENLRAGARYASEKSKAEGFLALRVEHADDRATLEQAIVDAGGIPVYERNRDVLVLHFGTLIDVTKQVGLLAEENAALLEALKKLQPHAESLKELLTKDIADIRWEDLRAALNAIGADIIVDFFKAGAKSEGPSALKKLLDLLRGTGI